MPLGDYPLCPQPLHISFSLIWADNSSKYLQSQLRMYAFSCLIMQFSYTHNAQYMSIIRLNEAHPYSPSFSYFLLFSVTKLMIVWVTYTVSIAIYERKRMVKCSLRQFTQNSSLLLIVYRQSSCLSSTRCVPHVTHLLSGSTWPYPKALIDEVI